uniref:Bifunctional dihydrofolate reductase-thymidylate synthase n=1 Tax=Ananas comosus var. bracteatus TaxID=296719 RepID=A0A6V7Q5L8_ANACO|nr:unnamed protein product [Ananas comosus var. bracteatus]
MAAYNPMAYANGDSQNKPERTYQVVVAATQKLGIGKDGELPWKLPSDLKFFKEVTTTTSDPAKKNAVIMGRKTWESIPLKEKPLRNRFNIVLTRSGRFDIATEENVVTCASMTSALRMMASAPFCLTIEKVFVIGGGEVLRDALNAPGCEAIHLTNIETNIECDTFIPPVDLSVFHPWYSSFPLVENNTKYSFVTFVRVRNSATEMYDQKDEETNGGPPCNHKFEVEEFSFLPKMVLERHEEFKYLKLVQDIIANGARKNDRTLTGTLSKFGCQMRFNMRRYFPLLTTKRVFWRGVVEELLWFISGSTNAKVLEEKGIHIWESNASREYLDSVGLKDREAGDLGPIYGFQWRHFGAEYTDMHADYTGKGFDQLSDKMALPPCHMFAQFYVENGELSCQMYQRSADMGLGVPFNIASYSLLTCMIAHVCGLSPGEFIHVIGDAHVYRNHVVPLEEQLARQPKPFPILKINPMKKDIDSFEASDFELIGYDPHYKIAMDLAV